MRGLQSCLKRIQGSCRQISHFHSADLFAGIAALLAIAAQCKLELFQGLGDSVSKGFDKMTEKLRAEILEHLSDAIFVQRAGPLLTEKKI